MAIVVAVRGPPSFFLPLPHFSSSTHTEACRRRRGRGAEIKGFIGSCRAVPDLCDGEMGLKREEEGAGRREKEGEKVAFRKRKTHGGKR